MSKVLIFLSHFVKSSIEKVCECIRKINFYYFDYENKSKSDRFFGVAIIGKIFLEIDV